MYKSDNMSNPDRKALTLVLAVVLASVALAVGYCLMQGETLFDVLARTASTDTAHSAKLIVALGFGVCAYFFGVRWFPDANLSGKIFLFLVFIAVFPMLSMDIPFGRHHYRMDTTPDDVSAGAFFLVLTGAGYLLGVIYRWYLEGQRDDSGA